MARASGIRSGSFLQLAATPIGLTSAEARRRLAEFGPNAVAEEAPPRWRVFLAKFWAPIPWMLEAAIVLQLGLGEYVEAAVIGGSAPLQRDARLHPGRPGGRGARGAQEAARADRLVRRDGEWVRLPASELVPGDAIRLPLGAVVPADATHRVGIGDGRPVDAHRRIRSGRCRSRQPGLRGLAGAPRPGDRRGDGDRVQDLFRAHGRARARRPLRQHRAGGHFRGDAKPRHRERHGRGSHHRLRLRHGVAVSPT